MLKRFGQNFLASLTNPQVYVGVINQPGVVVALYFYVTTAILSLITATWLYFYFRPQFVSNLEVLRAEISDSFPADRQLAFDGEKLEIQAVSESGEVTPAQNELRIASPAVLPRLFGFSPTEVRSWQTNWPTNLVIVSPTAVTDPTAYLTQLDDSTLVVVDPNSAYIFDGEKEWKPISLKDNDIPAGTITKPFLTEKLMQWRESATIWIAKNAIYIWPLIVIFTLINQSLVLTWNGFLVFLISKVFGYKLGYGGALKLSAYVLVVALFISEVAHLIYPWLPLDMMNLSFWAIIAYLLWALRTHLPRVEKPLVT